jgi:hypothetical protein
VALIINVAKGSVQEMLILREASKLKLDVEHLEESKAASTQTSTIEDLIKELLSPNGSNVVEYEVEPDLIDITIDYDMPEHGFTVKDIKSKFDSVFSRFTVEKGSRAENPLGTARRYYFTPKQNLTTMEVHKLSKKLEKLAKVWK